MLTPELISKEMMADSPPLQQERLEGFNYLCFKRGFDQLFCLGALPFVLLIMAIVALAIFLTSFEAPIFIQERVGKNGKRFRLYKFRTMPKNHDDSKERAFMQAYVSGEIPGFDPCQDTFSFKPPDRVITRVGEWLRKASLDELPQIFNVMRGEMSLIGPRPNVAYEVEKYRDWHYARLAALPGITGLAQINGRSNITFDEIARYDIYYARHVSLKLDIYILWQTIRIVLSGQGAC